MSKKWLRERSKDHWYKLAKREGWRSRASFKLLQIEERYGVIGPGDKVVDLGAAPGGWSQVAVELCGALEGEGTVVGVDLDKIEEMPGATFIRGDMTKSETVGAVLTAIGGSADVVISDMSPNISGSYATDQARSVWLCDNALAFAGKVLRPGGRFVCKVFEGDLFPPFLEKVRHSFDEARVMNPPASRKASSEVYVIGLDFKRPPAYAPLKDENAWEEGMGLPPSRRPRAIED